MGKTPESFWLKRILRRVKLKLQKRVDFFVFVLNFKAMGPISWGRLESWNGRSGQKRRDAERRNYTGDSCFPLPNHRELSIIDSREGPEKQVREKWGSRGTEEGEVGLLWHWEG